jgi:hypothetical protein
MSKTQNITVITEVNGYQYGINGNPDVTHLPESDRYMIIEPDGEVFTGGVKGITRLFNKLTGSTLPEDPTAPQ